MTSTKPKHRKRYSITITTPLAIELQANHLALYTPALQDICTALKTSLSSNYTNVDVSVVKCPDMIEYCNLAAHGLCGNCKLAEVGGSAYLYKNKWQSTTYEIPDIVNTCGYRYGKALVIGGGQAAPEMLGKNGLVIINSKIPSGPRHSRCVKVSIEKKGMADDSKTTTDEITVVDDEQKDVSSDEVICVENYPSDGHGCLSNVFLSDGKIGEVIHIKVSVRTGELSIIHAIQKALQMVSGCSDGKQIGMGGVIKVLNGKICGHVQRGFIECEVNEVEKIDGFEKYLEADDNLVMFACVMSGDPSLFFQKNFHLTLDNTYFYSLNKFCTSQAGKYKCDVTADVIEYECYFSVAESIYRIEDAVYNLSLIDK